MRRVALLLLVGVPLAEAWFSWLRVPLARRPVLEGVDLRRRRVAIDEDWAVSVFEIASVGSRVRATERGGRPPRDQNNMRVAASLLLLTLRLL